jgi:homoserine kinase type II
MPSVVCLPDDHLVCQVVSIIESEYATGPVVGVEQLYGGYTNLSFAVSVFRGGEIHKLFFRKYWLGVTPDVIEFEHAFLAHVISRGADFVAGVISTREGRGYASRVEVVGGVERVFYYAAFDFIGGLDKYSWISNHLTTGELVSAGAALAALHVAARDFSSGDLPLPRDVVTDVVPRLSGLLADCVDRAEQCCYCRYFLRNAPDILGEIDRVTAILREVPDMPLIGVHGDFHPGNQKYFNDRIVGIFDFDRANIDLRVYDLALAVVYFCSVWGGGDDGSLCLERMGVFLGGYQGRAGEDTLLGAMDGVELEYFSAMLAAANLVLIKWATVDSFFVGEKECDSAEYLSYLRHHVRLMRWIRGNAAGLSRTLRSLACLPSSGQRPPSPTD